MRRNAILSVCFVMLALISNAQDGTFKPFKVDIALGYATPSSGKGAKGGVLFAVEPKYALNDKITVGLRLESALMVRANVNSTTDDTEGDVKASGSYLATADYYFNTNDFRPFVGIGAGLYQTATADLSSTTTQDDIATGSKFGVAPRAGFEYKHFRLALEYNVAGKTGSVNNSYLGIKFGFFIGGGRIAN